MPSSRLWVQRLRSQATLFLLFQWRNANRQFSINDHWVKIITREVLLNSIKCGSWTLLCKFKKPLGQLNLLIGIVWLVSSCLSSLVCDVKLTNSQYADLNNCLNSVYYIGIFFTFTNLTLCDNVFLVQVDLIVSTFVICFKLLFKFVKNCLNSKVQMWLCTIFVLVGYLFTMQISDVTVMWLV